MRGGGDFKYKTSASAVDVTSTAGWATLSTGVEGTLTGDVPFAEATTDRVTYGLAITRDEQTVPIAGGATAQSKIEGSATCW
ncbi:hypothetical protein [Microbacterium sp. C7(2022)]|uniref:hypothetical protein n=1 Tax=Microbacterium sp. C7(2022) TaxID=2992759 RepID=UPI00237A46DF|nr:hypothetical protein [Microbacterium sp. C7(2022)]MDE0546717.1 hypothetical protein [Microbacterium sp. C7(2022)]